MLYFQTLIYFHIVGQAETIQVYQQGLVCRKFEASYVLLGWLAQTSAENLLVYAERVDLSICFGFICWAV